MRSPEPLVECHDVGLAYGAHPVMEGARLALHDGEFWVFLGANGQGKSSLLRGILGLLAPVAGEIRLAPALAGGRAIGYVPQRLDWQQSLPCTVREFVRLGMVGLAVPRAARAARLAAALARVHIAELAQRDLRQLSGGERQRALVARALVREPRLLILDEPTTGLDIAAERVLVDCLTDLHGGGMAVLLVTHDLRLARLLASHAALFAGGRLQVGPAAQMLTEARLATVFQLPVAQS